MPQWKRVTVRKRGESAKPVLLNMDNVLYVVEDLKGATIVMTGGTSMSVNENYDHFDPRPTTTTGGQPT